MATPAPNLMTPQTMDQLQKLAQSQVNAEVGGQITPLQSNIDALNASQQAAGQKMETMFGTLLPYVSNAARDVAAAHDNAVQSEQSIFNTAQANLAQLRAQRAQSAQTLAQQMGGPVALGEFTAGVEPSQEYLASVAPGALLHSLALGEAGNQEAQAFAGKVFPLVRTEQQANLDNYFNTQKKSLQDQINQLQASKSGLVNSRLNDLQKQERDFQLQKTQQQLDRLKADRDWQATKRTLKNDDARLRIAQDEAANQTASTTGVDPRTGKKTVAAREIEANIAHMSASDRLAARQLSLSEREYATRQYQLKQAGKLAAAKTSTVQQQLAMEIIDQATNPQPGKSMTQTVTTEIDPSQAILNKKAYGVKGADGQTHYYVDRTVTIPGPTSVPIQDPQRLYEMLLGYKIPPKMASKLVKSKLGTPDFAPGKTNYTAKQLAGMPFSEMRGVAIQLGFRPDPKNPRTKKQLIQYIVSHQ